MAMVMGAAAAAGQPAGQGGRSLAAERAGVAPIPLYQEYCARCHGPEGGGDGPHAPKLEPAPRSFHLGYFKIKTSMRMGPHCRCTSFSSALQRRPPSPIATVHSASRMILPSKLMASRR